MTIPFLDEFLFIKSIDGIGLTVIFVIKEKGSGGYLSDS